MTGYEVNFGLCMIFTKTVIPVFIKTMKLYVEDRENGRMNFITLFVLATLTANSYLFSRNAVQHRNVKD